MSFHIKCSNPECNSRTISVHHEEVEYTDYITLKCVKCDHQLELTDGQEFSSKPEPFGWKITWLENNEEKSLTIPHHLTDVETELITLEGIGVDINKVKVTRAEGGHEEWTYGEMLNRIQSYFNQTLTFENPQEALQFLSKILGYTVKRGDISGEYLLTKSEFTSKLPSEEALYQFANDAWEDVWFRFDDAFVDCIKRLYQKNGE